VKAILGELTTPEENQLLTTFKIIPVFPNVKVLNQDTCKIVQLDFLRDQIISLQQHKSLDINEYYCLVLIFLDGARFSNMEVSVDQIRFLLDLLPYTCKAHSQENTKEETEKYRI
jgi:hypothetical protein